MQAIPRLEADGESDQFRRLRQSFAKMQKGARLRGLGEVLMELDRVAGLVLGPKNRVSEGAEEAAVPAAATALGAIAKVVQQGATSES